MPMFKITLEADSEKGLMELLKSLSEIKTFNAPGGIDATFKSLRPRPQSEEPGPWVAFDG